MQSLTVCGFLLLLSLACTIQAKSDVVKLTTANFEHLTQAATGATTGDWMVEFFAPWCGHCKRLAPTYEKVATELKGKVNVASVDVTENQPLGSRFGIRGFPTILFIRQGKVYKFSGKRELETMVDFALNSYSKVQAVDVPQPPSISSMVMDHAKIIGKDFEELLLTKKNVLLTVFGIGMLIGAFLAAICCLCCGRSSDAIKQKTQ